MTTGELLYGLFVGAVVLWAVYRWGISLYERNKANDYAGFTESQKRWAQERDRRERERALRKQARIAEEAEEEGQG